MAREFSSQHEKFSVEWGNHFYDSQFGFRDTQAFHRGARALRFRDTLRLRRAVSVQFALVGRVASDAQDPDFGAISFAA
eukprot:3102704-Prymnesium_polylepis.1